MFMYRFRSIRRSVPGCVSTESLKIIAASTTPCAGQDLLHGSEVHCAAGPASLPYSQRQAWNAVSDCRFMHAQCNLWGRTG